MGLTATEAFIPYYVARIGAANYRDEVTGRFFSLDATGHLLNAHYLNHFVAGRYQPTDGGGKSRLMGYVKALST